MGSTFRMFGIVTVTLLFPLLSYAQVNVIGAPPVLPGPPIPVVSPITIASNNASTTLAKVGDTITVSFTSSLASLLTPTVTIAGHAAAVVTGAVNSWIASTVMTASDIEGTITFLVTVGNASGTATTTVSGTSNGLSVVFDKTPPVITLNGAATVALNVGDTFTDAGASAFDGDSPVTVSETGSVDTSTAGSYTLTYDAKDPAGNDASVTRTVTVNAVESASVVSSGGGGGNGPIAGSLTVFLPEAPPTPVTAEVAVAVSAPQTSPVPDAVPENSGHVVAEVAAPVAPAAQTIPVAPIPSQQVTQAAAAASAIPSFADYWLEIVLFLCVLGLVGWWIGDSYKAQAKYGN